MAKKIVRSLLTGILVFALAILAGSLAFLLTYRYQTEKIQAERATVSAQQVYQPQLPACTYLVRLENNALSVYARLDNREEFLYALEVPVSELPPSDVKLLEKGLLLPTKEALTSLEEDYTS